MQAELDSLETELADPTNPLLQEQEDDQENKTQLDPGELMRGLVDVRGRLEKVKKGREGRGKLVGAILEKEKDVDELKRDLSRAKTAEKGGEVKEKQEKEENHELAELDSRVGELEDLIGSSSVALDEVCLSFIKYWIVHNI